MRFLVKYQSNLTVRLRDIINIIKLNNIFLKNIYYLAGTERMFKPEFGWNFGMDQDFEKKNILIYFIFYIRSI